MNKPACLLAASSALAFMIACSSSPDDQGVSSTDALTTLTVAQCKTPQVHTSAKNDASGSPIAGSAHTTLSGCIVGSQGETGDGVITRLETLLGDMNRLGSVTDPQGQHVFQQFTPKARHGALATGITQDIDVTLKMDHSPYTTLHTVQKKASGQPYSLSITNSAPVLASVAIFSVTVVQPGNLTLDIHASVAANGVTITGATDIILEQNQDQAAQASVLVSDVFHWLTTELAKSAPPAQAPVVVHDAGTPPSDASSDSDAPAPDAAPHDAGAPNDASPE